MKSLAAVLAALFVTLLSAPAFAEGDPKKGKRVFNKCRACHTLEAGKNRIGPSLHGMFGRRAGTAPGYKFSKAMKKYGAKDGANVIWTPELFRTYIAKPRKVVKGTKMAFPGLKKKADRDNLTAYLMEATK